MADFPGFPALAGVSQKAPLTARATVTETSSSGASAPAPIQATSARSNLEHRNKGDPLLTRLLYGMLAWVSNVPLEKGYSQVDWMRRSRATNPPPLRRDITMAEVKQHRTREDAWMVFRNKVYDITSYFKFHPGGADMLFKAAGKDGTSLFMKYHPWVNIDALMEKCLVGVLADESVSGPSGKAAVQEVEGEGTDGGVGTQQGPGQATAAMASEPGAGQVAVQQGQGHVVDSNQTPNRTPGQTAGQTAAIASAGVQGSGIGAEGTTLSAKADGESQLTGRQETVGRLGTVSAVGDSRSQGQKE